jgi:hypothetical protein
MGIISLANHALGMVRGIFRRKRRMKMPKICVLHVPGKQAVYVNPALVRALEDRGKYTTIQFDKDHLINIDLPIDQVRHALDVAMNADQL